MASIERWSGQLLRLGACRRAGACGSTHCWQSGLLILLQLQPTLDAVDDKIIDVAHEVQAVRSVEAEVESVLCVVMIITRAKLGCAERGTCLHRNSELCMFLCLVCVVLVLAETRLFFELSPRLRCLETMSPVGGLARRSF